jgi:hypothetical protein
MGGTWVETHVPLIARNYDSPSIVPFACTFIPSAAGTLPSPGIVMMSPVLQTTKPAPAEP